VFSHYEYRCSVYAGLGKGVKKRQKLWNMQGERRQDAVLRVFNAQQILEGEFECALKLTGGVSRDEVRRHGRPGGGGW
jgi:hypothetical protein